MDEAFMDRLVLLRLEYGRPMVVTSAYRCADHPVERRKSTPGVHNQGRAVDIAVFGSDAHDLLRMAMEFGFQGIGVNQKGDGRFVHMDMAEDIPRPAVWSYD